MLVTGNGYPTSSRHSREHFVKVLAFESSQRGLGELLEIAVTEEWPSTIQTVQSKGVVHDDLPRPKSVKSGADNAWFRLGVEGGPGTSCTVDVQPLFTEGVRPTDDSPLFVRKYDGRAGFSAGLHAIFEVNNELELRQYQLLGNLSLEFTGLSIEEVDGNNLAQRAHRSTLATLDQHRPSVVSGEMPLDQVLRLDGFGD